MINAGTAKLDFRADDDLFVVQLSIPVIELAGEHDNGTSDIAGQDDENKRSQILQYIRSTWKSASLATASSFQTGLRALKEAQFSFVILDMTLPNYEVGPEEDGGELRQLGGGRSFSGGGRGQLLIPNRYRHSV